MKIVAYQRVDADGETWDLAYDTDDVVKFETPIDVHDVTQAGDTAVRRKLGQAHLLLHFREGSGPRWVPCDQETEGETTVSSKDGDSA